MILQLTTDAIIDNWDLIKYGALRATGYQDGKVQEAANGLLVNLLKTNYQCWMAIDEQTRKIKAVAITRIYEDSSSVRNIEIESLYGFLPTSMEDKLGFISTLEKFGINQGMRGGDITAFSASSLAVNAMAKVGMKEVSRKFSKKIGE